MFDAPSWKLEHEHSREAIRERLSSGPSHNYLRDWIYGGIDGTVTTFAVITGVVGAELSLLVILVLGFANLVADGFSMAVGNYLGTKAEREDFEHLEAVEKKHIEVAPEGEKEEVKQIYRAKGFEGVELDRVVEIMTSNRERWVRTMLTEEYGLPAEIRSPWLAAVSTFSAFIVCGMAPLTPYVLGTRHAFTFSAAFTGVVFFTIGALKSKWSTVTWWRSGLTTFAVGTVAALLAYAVGVLIKTIASGGPAGL